MVAEGENVEAEAVVFEEEEVEHEEAVEVELELFQLEEKIAVVKKESEVVREE